jgi:hypothetical protein
MKQGNVSKQLGVLCDAQLLRRTREGNFIRYATRDDAIIQLCNLVCRKIETMRLPRLLHSGSIKHLGKEKIPKRLSRNSIVRAATTLAPR